MGVINARAVSSKTATVTESVNHRIPSSQPLGKNARIKAPKTGKNTMALSRYNMELVSPKNELASCSVTRSGNYFANVGDQKKLNSTNSAIVPTTINMTYCRRLPVCTTFSETPIRRVVLATQLMEPSTIK